MLFFCSKKHKEHHHKFIVLESSLINREDVYHIKVRNTQSFFRVTLDEILSDTHLLFGLPSAQSCSIAIDACHYASSHHNISNKIELAAQAAWRAINSTEYSDYSLVIVGYGEKLAIRFQSTERQKNHKRCAIQLIKNHIISQFSPPSALIIGCVAALRMEKPKKTPHLRLIA